MLQKQLAKSRVAMYAEEEPRQWACKIAPTSTRVGRRNFTGGIGQLELRVRMLMMRAAFVLLLRLTNTSALGRPGCMATRPAARRASSMACTRGQLDGFWGGVRASAKSNPPGALDSQISGGIWTKPAGRIPRRTISNGGGSREPGTKAGEVSDVWLSGRDRACVCKMCSVTRRRETSSGAGLRRLGDIQPTVADIQSCSRVTTRGFGAESLLARRRAAPRRCIRAGREQDGQGECI